MRITRKYVLFILLMLALAACQPGTATPTQQGNQIRIPAVSGGEMPAAGATSEAPLDAYPGLQTLVPPEQGYPGAYAAPGGVDAESYPGPMGVPAIENRSKVVAQLLEQKAGPSPEQIILRVKIVSSETVENMPEFTSQLIGSEAEFVVTLAGLPVMKAGDQFQAEVSFRGDENGGRYFAEKVEKR